MRKRKALVLSVCTLAVLLGLWMKALQDRKFSISRGVIGAADGPTSILVSCQINEQLLYGVGRLWLSFPPHFSILWFYEKNMEYKGIVRKNLPDTGN